MADSRPSELNQLRMENARLMELLVARRSAADPVHAVRPHSPHRPVTCRGDGHSLLPLNERTDHITTIACTGSKLAKPACASSTGSIWAIRCRNG